MQMRAVGQAMDAPSVLLGHENERLYGWMDGWVNVMDVRHPQMELRRQSASSKIAAGKKGNLAPRLPCSTPIHVSGCSHHLRLHYCALTPP